MTDAFLDDHETIQFMRDARAIARLLPHMLAIARREVSPPGGRFARNPNVPSSTPPIRVGALDANTDIDTILESWTKNLAEDAGIEPPVTKDGSTLAIHLTRHSHVIAQQVWASDCADEIRSCAKRLRYAVEPPEAEYIGPCQADGPPQCRGIFSGDGRDGDCRTCGAQFDAWALKATVLERIDEGLQDRLFTAREIVDIARDRYGIEIKRQHIDDMMRRPGDPLTNRGTNRDGRKLFRAQDVIDRAHRQKRKA